MGNKFKLKQNPSHNWVNPDFKNLIFGCEEYEDSCKITWIDSNNRWCSTYCRRSDLEDSIKRSIWVVVD